MQDYDIETETFNLPYPTYEVVRVKVEKDLKDKKINISAHNSFIFDAQFKAFCGEYGKNMLAHYYKSKNEFEEKLNEKHGGVLNRMEAKHGLSRFPAKLRGIIHSKAYQEGHSGGEDEINNCYYDIVEFVDSVIATIK